MNLFCSPLHRLRCRGARAKRRFAVSGRNFYGTLSIDFPEEGGLFSVRQYVLFLADFRKEELGFLDCVCVDWVVIPLRVLTETVPCEKQVWSHKSFIENHPIIVGGWKVLVGRLLPHLSSNHDRKIEAPKANQIVFQQQRLKLSAGAT